MLRTTSRTLATALGVALVLAAATPSSAQNTKRTKQARKPSATPVASSAKVKRVSSPRSRTVRTTARALGARSTARSNETRTTVRVNRAAAPRSNSRNTLSNAFSSRARLSDLKVKPRERNRDVDREAYADMFRRRPDDNRNRQYDDGRDRRARDSDRRANDNRNRRRYDSGFTYRYHRGYHRGYNHGRNYRHNHYYGSHLIFGYHYGGFGFYNGRWHFAIVIGTPVLVHRRYRPYSYSWWDGYGTGLTTWDRAMEVYPASYTFDVSGGSCVELWLRTTDGADYEIKIDPRYYNARDPGDLYAALWGELEREGQLQLEDVNGAVHVFPAGMIQQIEARPCN